MRSVNLSLRTLDRLCLVIVILALAGSGFWVLGQAIVQRREIRIEQEILSKKMQDLKVTEIGLRQLQAVLRDKRTAIAALDERVPESAQMGRFLKELGGLTKRRQVLLISLQPMPPVEEKLYIRNPVNLVCKGPFINVYQLLVDFESMNRLLEMGTLKITRTAEERLCQVDLVVNVFERKVKKGRI
jgi:Tfp pilus assembly protein PilO